MFEDLFSLKSLLKILSTVLALLIAIVGHEIMHGYVAYRYKDYTAKKAGRLSINPIKHIDIVGSIIVPLVLFLTGVPFLFAWAKPVPVDMNTIIKNGGYNAAMSVSLAGIFYNFVLAILALLLFLSLEKPSNYIDVFFFYFFSNLVIINIILGVFNLWPIPSFDGGNFLAFLSAKYKWNVVLNILNRLRPYSIVILIIILITPLNKVFFYPAFVILSLIFH